MSSGSEVTSALALSGSLLDGGFSPDQIRKRCKKWNVPYKAHAKDYWFRTEDFMKAFHEKEFSTATAKKDARTKNKKEEEGKS